MKKLIFLLAFIVGIAASAFSQGTIVNTLTLASDTVKGAADSLIVYSPVLDEYWDYSIQFKSTFYGVGDSSYLAISTHRTNDISQTVWEEITAERDTLVSAVDDAGLTVDVTDFTGVWLKHILVGIATDTVVITPYVVMKQKRNRFF